MKLYLSPNTCSMGEVGQLTMLDHVDVDGRSTTRSRNYPNALAKVIAEARQHHRKFLVANLSQVQYGLKPLRAALRAKKFTFVGKYQGNNSPVIYVFTRGLTK